MSEFETYTAEPPAPAGTPSAEERQWGLFGHLSSLAGLFTGGIGNIIGPLIIWLVKKDTMPFAADQAKEALNFNITLLIASIVLILVTVFTLFIAAFITIPLGIGMALFGNVAGGLFVVMFHIIVVTSIDCLALVGQPSPQ